MPESSSHSARLHTLRQRLSVPLTNAELQAVLHDMLTLMEEQLGSHEALMVAHKDLMATITRQTYTIEQQTATIERLTAERERLLHLAHHRIDRGTLLLCHGCGAAIM